MSQLHLWLGLQKLLVKYETSEFTEDVLKICTVNDSVFILTKSRSVYYGNVDQGIENCSTLVLTKSNISAIDISCNITKLYFVSDCGKVFKTSPVDLDNCEEIVLKEDAKCCAHGYKTLGHKIKVKSVAVTERGCLFVTENGQLWASGEHSQLTIQEDEPKKVLFFEKRFVKSVCCGSDFSLALVQKPGQCISDKDDTDEEEDDGEVFVSTCPSCVSECVSSPMSQQSTSETCPLGLHIQPPNVDHYSSSTASKDNTAEDKKSTDESTSASIAEESVRKELTCESDVNPDTNENIDADVELRNKDSGNELRDVTKLDSDEGSESKSELSKLEKKNEFFINTDAARQFLTRQLSWVSSYGGASEELLVECAEASLVRPSRIIKQNVSNMANLVYEGVKTVGDRVATLSRHMSGGSETSDSIPGGLGEFESFEELSTDDLKPAAASITSSMRCEEFVGSSSAGTSERGEDSDVGVTERIASLVRAGSALLTVELWAWGNVYHGQLGTGDTTRKNRPALVSRLSGLGVCRIACGLSHALAVTMDGRVFAWGKNTSYQVTLDSPSDQSSPQQICSVPSAERARDVAAGASHSVIMTNERNVYFLGKQNKGLEASGAIIQFEVPSLSEGRNSQKQIFASRHLSGCYETDQPVSMAVQDLAIEQSFLEEAIIVQNGVLKPLQKKCSVTHENNVYDSLCVCYSELLGITALNVLTLWDFMEYGGEASSVTMVHNVEEHVRVYRNYLNVLCDVISLSGFVHIAKIIDIPQKMFAVFSERLQTRKSKKSPEAIISCALLSPLNRLSIYKCMIQSLLRCNANTRHPPLVKQQVERRLQEALVKWEQIWEDQERRKREADATRLFWESSGPGRLVELLRSPERRLVRESRSHPIFVYNSGRFSSHWLILLTDVLVHVSGSTPIVHPLTTVWVEPLQDTDTLQNALVLTMPEETLTLYSPTANDKKEWFQDLQNTIKRSLLKPNAHLPPVVRSATYTFIKHVLYKDAKYTGRWCNGKLQGAGKLEWPDGKMYVGQFQNNQLQGFGHLETPGVSVYEGQWRDGQQNGLGTIRYAGGDVYEGHFKDGLAHGHGVRKQGHFMASVASVYVGEWVAGIKQGYGVMDDIITGEKYLGCWSNNLKHGCGLIVTLDGIYYEGVFMQDVLTGHGVMVFEDGTHYEGEFRSAGVFSGKGTLTFNSGDRLEGSLHGAWNEGVKVTGTLHKNMATAPTQLCSRPNSFGKLCVSAHQKWKAIFRQCYQQLGVSDVGLKTALGVSKVACDVQKVWENVAVLISNSRQETLQRPKGAKGCSKEIISGDTLDTIPKFGRDLLDMETYLELRRYLSKAFDSPHHPLGLLLAEVCGAYTATYGGVRVHPLLLSHAVEELHSITGRIYDVVRLLFPALPLLGQELQLGEGQAEHESEVVSVAAMLHPVLLPRVHSALFVLYALHNKQEDDAYWKRLLKWNKQPDITLMAFLGIDQKFWVGYSSPKHMSLGYEHQPPFSPLREQLFNDAVETLQQLKTTFSPLEKLLVIQSTFEQMTRAVQQELGTSYLWTMDDLFPVFHFVVVRSRILQLGSEIHFIEDFMEPYLQNGELGIMFTTLKACYYQILQEKISMSS